MRLTIKETKRIAEARAERYPIGAADSANQGGIPAGRLLLMDYEESSRRNHSRQKAFSAACELVRRRFLPRQPIHSIIGIPVSRLGYNRKPSYRIPKDRLYSKDHIRIKASKAIATIGLPDDAQDSMGEIVYVKLARVEDTLRAHESFGSVESVKALSELFTPVSGRVIQINKQLEDNPKLINQDPYGKGWLMEIRLDRKEELGKLLKASEYKTFVQPARN